MRLLAILIFCINCTFIYCQKIDNTVSYREIANESYFRVNYENDYFAAQDKNYTQGYSFEYVSPFLIKNPINKLFFHFGNNQRKAGIVFEHIGFTPVHYDRLEIQHGDRPFSATALLKNFSNSTDQASKQRLASHFSFGVMGPSAKGEEIQAGIHRLTGDRTPHGWKNQIQNHFVINYGLDYEKELIRIKDYFGISTHASAKIGNLFSNLTTGFNSTFGLINNPYQKSNNKKFRLYGYMQGLVTVVAYDATLQGRLFGNESVYTIPSKDINRIVSQVNYGIVLQTKSIYLEYARTYISKEIKTLIPAGWGGIKIGFRL